jgi:tetratricopeptide (TPR) repeat protein
MLVEVHGQAVWMGYGNPAERAAQARTALQNAKRLAPEAPETVAAEAEYAYRLENNFPRARDLFDQAHRLLPGDVDILFRRGVAQRRTPQLDAALETFEQALAMDPNFGRVAVVLTETLMSMGRFEEMGRRLGDFLITYPDARDLQAYRAELYMRQNQLAQARTVIDGMQPSVGSAYFWAATNLPFLERDYDKAIEVLEIPEVAAFLQTRGLVGYRELSRAYALGFMGDDDGMRREARAAIAAIEAAPAAGTYNDAFELGTQMVAEALLGDREAALATASRAYEALNPDKDFLFGSFVAHNRCLVLAMVGDREEALAEIERWLDAPYPLQRELLRISPYWDFLRGDERFNIMIGAGDASASGP